VLSPSIRLWAGQKDLPLLQSERFRAGNFDFQGSNSFGRYPIGWEVRSPKMPTKKGVLFIEYCRDFSVVIDSAAV
jgi:hypothetical protein